VSSASPHRVVLLCPLCFAKAFADNYYPNSATYALPKPRPVVRTHPLDNLGVLNDDFPFENGQKIDGIV